jgi:hypothetical protein
VPYLSPDRYVYLLVQTLNVNGVVTVDRGFGAVDFDDVAHVLGGHGGEADAAIAPRIVLFGHQHIE